MLTATRTTPEPAPAASSGAMSPWRRRSLILICWLAAVALGAVHTWAARHNMNADGMSYLDLADAWRTGHWADAINAYWSPLYSWLLALALSIAKPTPYWEASVAHIVNFAGYLLSLACFHYFWTGLRRHVDRRWQAIGRTDESTLREWAWILLGYALCVWILLDWITISLVTPDMFVAAFVFVDAGLLVRIRGGKAGRATFLLLGIALGLGYLTKAILLPMAAVFMAFALLASPRRARTLPRLILTAAVFAALGGPWVYAMSKAKGRFTTGDTGRLNYAFIVNGFKPWDVWQGEPPPAGRNTRIPANSTDPAEQPGHRSLARHPARRLLDGPHVFEFADPVPGTYPLWYDPSYWHEGAEPYFDMSRQMSVLKQQLGAYFDLFCREQGLMTFVLLSLLLIRGGWMGILRDWLSLWWIALPALAGLGAYALINVESRYVGPFVVVLWGTLLVLARLPRSEMAERVIGGAAAAMITGLVLTVGYSSIPAVREAATDVRNRCESRTNWHWSVAREMVGAGLRAGDQIGHIGQALKSWSYWARLAGVRITAELRPGESFWLADDATRDRVLGTFRSAGQKVKLKAVVTRKQEIAERPFGLACDFAPGWQPVGNTGFYIRFLDKPASSSTTRPSTTPSN